MAYRPVKRVIITDTRAVELVNQRAANEHRPPGNAAAVSIIEHLGNKTFKRRNGIESRAKQQEEKCPNCIGQDIKNSKKKGD
ncbi:MAG: hypothetical protein ABIG61_07575 [Planctomycetota bacterium]